LIETRYKHEAIVDGDTVMFEILDTCPAASEDQGLCSGEAASWADGFVLVFAITDRKSFQVLQQVRRQIRDARDANWPLPCVLVGSKADMLHLRQVATFEGQYIYFQKRRTFAKI